jgi:hypothetical protein
VQNKTEAAVLEAGLFAEVQSEAAREMRALLEHLSNDRSHSGWKALLAVLQRRVTGPLARKFPSVTDADDALSTLSAMMTVGTDRARPWLADYLELTQAGGAAQPFGRFLERRLRDVLRERAETAGRRRDSDVVPVAVWEFPSTSGPVERLLRDAARTAVEARRKGSEPSDEAEEDERVASLRGTAMLILRESGFTQTEIAETLSTSVASVNRWFKHVETVHAERMPTVRSVAAAASSGRKAQSARRLDPAVAAVAGAASLVVASVAAIVIAVVVSGSDDRAVVAAGPAGGETVPPAGSGLEERVGQGEPADVLQGGSGGGGSSRPLRPIPGGGAGGGAADLGSASRDLPPTPSSESVASAMYSISGRAAACGSGEHGLANVRIVFAGSTGRVTSATLQDGPFSAPVRECVEAAARTAAVPPFGQPQFSIVYPFRL